MKFYIYMCNIYNTYILEVYTFGYIYEYTH